MNIKQMFVGATICLSSLGFTFVTLPEEALACNTGLSRLDPTCPGGIFNPRGNSGSCLQQIVHNVYEVTIVNKKSYEQYYRFDGERYTLSSGYQRTHKKTIASGTNSCNVENYPLPVIEFDRYANDGSYTEHQIELSYQNNFYYFWRDGETIKFSSN